MYIEHTTRCDDDHIEHNCVSGFYCLQYGGGVKLGTFVSHVRIALWVADVPLWIVDPPPISNRYTTYTAIWSITEGVLEKIERNIYCLLFASFLSLSLSLFSLSSEYGDDGDGDGTPNTHTSSLSSLNIYQPYRATKVHRDR